MAQPEKHTVLSTTQFTGVADAGLFQAGNLGAVGRGFMYVHIFGHVEGTAANWSVYAQDPDTANNKVLVRASSSATNDFVAEDIRIPVASDGLPWAVKLETTAKDDDGWAEFIARDD